MLDAGSHYGDPAKGACQSDEMAIKIQGVNGGVCSPVCSGTSCPSDVPSGVTAQPQCALQSPDNKKYCALICNPSLTGLEAANQCGDGASCKSLSGVGICTYDDVPMMMQDGGYLYEVTMQQRSNFRKNIWKN
jgi:hypothetical protein